jgi:hypothetical protein
MAAVFYHCPDALVFASTLTVHGNLGQNHYHSTIFCRTHRPCILTPIKAYCSTHQMHISLRRQQHHQYRSHQVLYSSHHPSTICACLLPLLLPLMILVVFALPRSLLGCCQRVASRPMKSFSVNSHSEARTLLM